MKEKNIEGSIINITSISATFVSHESASYQVSKAGLEQLTKYLAVYAGKYNIRINTITSALNIKDAHLENYNVSSYTT